jgi:hypothetical protein
MDRFGTARSSARSGELPVSPATCLYPKYGHACRSWGWSRRYNVRNKIILTEWNNTPAPLRMVLRPSCMRRGVLKPLGIERL